MTSPAKTTAAQAISLARLARLVILILKPTTPQPGTLIRRIISVLIETF